MAFKNSLSLKGTWRPYAAADGLAGVQVEHIAQDAAGFLWFATWDSGVSRFDGDEFRTFTRKDGLGSDRVPAVLMDSQERLWFGTWEGVCWYDGRTFHPLDEKRIAGKPVQFIFEDREGRVWFGGTGVLGCYVDEVYQDLVPLYGRGRAEGRPSVWGQCWGIAQDAGGDVWFALNQVLRYDGEELHRCNDRHGLPAGRAYVVGQDSAGEIWVGTGSELWRQDGEGFAPVEAALEGQLRKIYTDCEGRMWFCTSNGAWAYDGSGFHPFTPQEGLQYRVITSVFQDREGLIWFATWGNGVACYDPDAVQIVMADLSPRFVTSLMQDRRGHVWVGFGDPLLESGKTHMARYDGERVEMWGEGEGVDVGGCLAMCEDQEGRCWFGGGSGLFRGEGRDFHQEHLDPVRGDVGISAIAEDTQGRLFFGHWERGTTADEEVLFESPLLISYRDPQGLQTLFRDEVQKRDHRTHISTLVFTRDGDLWFVFGTHYHLDEDRGVGRWNPEDGVRFYTEADGLVDDRAVDLIEDRKGRLWIATLGGISCFDGRRFRSFTTEDGLPSNHVRCACEDRQGHLWFGTNAGVAHYDGQAFQTIYSPHIGPTLRIVQARDGSFWLATVSSVVRYTPGRTPPRVRVLRTIADQVYQDVESVEVTAISRQVIFEYKGMSCRTHPRHMLYRYRLRGYDDWQPITRRMRAYYRDLLPDEYVFEVQAIDQDLNYSEPAAVRLTVEPDPRIAALSDALSSDSGEQVFLTSSQALRQVRMQLAGVAPTDLTVLLSGETGTGKGLAARLVHQLSQRRSGAFIQINCGSIPEGLVESELFGHEKGAFTGAIARKLGKVELADGGTLFLDEVGDMSLGAQVRLLHLLEDHTFERVGGMETLTTDVRVVAATNRDLQEMVQAGRFREDLYFRLHVFPVELPPLREHPEDVPLLASYFIERAAAHLNKKVNRVSPEALAALQRYDWPGNVRELEHAIQRGVIVCPGSTIRLADISLDIGQEQREVAGEMVTLEEHERRYIEQVLEETGWVVGGPKGAAMILGMHPSTLRSRMKKLGIAH